MMSKTLQRVRLPRGSLRAYLKYMARTENQATKGYARAIWQYRQVTRTKKQEDVYV